MINPCQTMRVCEVSYGDDFITSVNHLRISRFACMVQVVQDMHSALSRH